MSLTPGRFQPAVNPRPARSRDQQAEAGSVVPEPASVPC